MAKQRRPRRNPADDERSDILDYWSGVREAQEVLESYADWSEVDMDPVGSDQWFEFLGENVEAGKWDSGSFQHGWNTALYDVISQTPGGPATYEASYKTPFADVFRAHSYRDIVFQKRLPRRR